MCFAILVKDFFECNQKITFIKLSMIDGWGERTEVGPALTVVAACRDTDAVKELSALISRSAIIAVFF